VNISTSSLSRPLRILQLLEPSGGGSGRHFVDLCGALSRDGHAVTAIYSPVRAEERFVAELAALGLEKVIAFPMRRAVGPWDFAAARAIARIIREDGPFDIVHGHSSKAGALARLRLPGRHIPRIYTPHAFRTMDPALGRLSRLVYGGVELFLGRLLSDRIICVSPSEYDHARSLGLSASTLTVVVNGVDTPPADRRDAIRRDLGLPAGSLVYGFIGRLSAQKAPERLIAAFADVAKTTPHAILVIIGTGELEPSVTAQIEALGLGHRVRLRSDIPGNQAIQGFDILVQPSRYEAMSYVMLEAAAAGKPMILTNVGGTSTVLVDGLNGILVANKDAPGDLAAAMAAVAAPALLQRFTTASEARRHGYGIQRMVDETVAIYRDALDANQRPSAG